MTHMKSSKQQIWRAHRQINKRSANGVLYIDVATYPEEEETDMSVSFKSNKTNFRETKSPTSFKTA